MYTFADTWYLSVIPALLAISMNLFCMMRMRETAARLNGIVQSREDLGLVRNAINLSMTLAVVFLAMWGLMILLLVYFVFSKGMPMPTAGGHLMLFGMLTLPVALMGKKFDTKIKSLDVKSQDPSMADTYRDYLMQWDKPQLKIKD